ncbi:hypothetical protein [Nakamurella endophytica]|uniref:hypothetical protein n=1 Tax=Nakamurella endophytica TaxID=1748367 RepID=UPI00166A09FD|nr:hypothetical protein [Nakamurella endophytica]
MPRALRRCGVADLGLTGRADRRTSQATHRLALTLRSTARSACALARTFTPVDMVAVDGTEIAGRVPSSGAQVPNALAVDPGQVVHAWAYWIPDTGDSRRVTRIVVHVGNSGPVLDLPVTDDGRRPPRVRVPPGSTVFQSAGYAFVDSAADPGTVASLTTSVSEPSTVRAGAAIVAHVVVRNLSNVAVPLTPCPEYDVQLSVWPGKVPTTTHHRGSLDCARMSGRLAPQQVVTVDTAVPAGEVAGDGVLTWALVDGRTAVTSDRLVITVHR